MFSGNPAGDCPPDEDPQACDPHGTTFSFTGGALFMSEIQYRPGASAKNDGAQSRNKPYQGREWRGSHAPPKTGPGLHPETTSV
jgi:hypothetical protein